METDKIIMYDPKRIKEAIILKRLAFFGVLLATVSTFLLIVLVPMLYNYVQMIQSELRDELDYCRHNTDHLWDEYYRVQRLVGPAEAKLNKREFYNRVFRSKRATGYDALVVVEGTTTAPAAASASSGSAAPAGSAGTSGASAPISGNTGGAADGYDKTPAAGTNPVAPPAHEPATSPTEVSPSSGTNNGGGYESVAPTPASSGPAGSAPETPIAPAAPGSETPAETANAEATFDGNTRENTDTNHPAEFDGKISPTPPAQPPTTQVPISMMSETHIPMSMMSESSSHDNNEMCSCGVGPAGPPGESGPDGKDGSDGDAGSEGMPGGDAAPDAMSKLADICQTCEESIPGPAGAAGPKGPSGKPGANGGKGGDGKPGAVGPIGPAGEAGKNGEAGIPGMPGETGMLDEIPGMPGKAGEPGPAGEAGPNGQPGPDGKPGPAGEAGPSGDAGKDGAAGRNGDDGTQGEAGEIGSNGQCSHCPPPRTAPGY